MYGFGSVLLDGAPKTPANDLKVHTKIKIEASLGQSPIHSKRLVEFIAPVCLLTCLPRISIKFRAICRQF
jgi:hypothetical protein